MNWRDVPVLGGWCLGLNDEFGTCAFAAVGNHAVLLGKGVMSDGEILNAAHWIEGLNDQDKSTDRGENVETLLNWIKTNGWPGDQTFTIASWSKVPMDEVAATIASRGAAESWLYLPMATDGINYDFTDGALARNAPGVYAHAVLVVKATPEEVTFITWARPQSVSRAWAEKYFQAFYDVCWTDIG